MVPAGPLMKEHRLIERIVPILSEELVRINKCDAVNSKVILSIVDFFRTYADRCHHGKEEDILFRALASKPLSDELRTTMNRLAEEHVRARKLVGRMLLDEARCAKADKSALAAVKQEIKEIVEFYPRHIELEDRHFFLPCMEYLNPEEQADLLRKFSEFDAKLIHEKYRRVIEELQGTQGS